MCLELATAIGSCTLISAVVHELQLVQWMMIWLALTVSFGNMRNEMARRYCSTAFCCVTAVAGSNFLLMDNYDWSVKVFLLSQGFFKSYSVLYYEPNSTHVLMNLLELFGILSTGMKLCGQHELESA